ncbi:Calcineurin-like phosphoesterase superfamily protein [Pilibacter termitis]|uniref:Calcineurin-like phosphoesterase superfamily protein n=1 Tax=Pilibacter termitis TaxID=263852 RepID=A0A1T4KTL2_9ENTE|nr:metallophosphoesterase [Pilibacter termitis]SJZ45746.1 Calcineurin-like phosphoesterase superfamily protein [Pilibacter termitis]
MTIWLTSDWHFQHQLVSKLRGFDSPELHDTAFIQKCQKMIAEDDIVFCLGDVVFNANLKGWQENLMLVNEIPGHKHLIAGNHDRCAVNNSNGRKYKQDFQKVFETVSEFVKISYDGTGFLLSHYPYDTTDLLFSNGNPATNKDAYSKYRLRDEGMPLIHGHTHTTMILTYSQNRTPQLNVNLESTKMRPVSIGELSRIMKSCD